MRTETDSVGKGEYVPGMVILIMDALSLSLSRRDLQPAELSACKGPPWNVTSTQRGVGPSTPDPQSSRQFVASSYNFYLRRTFLGRHTSMSSVRTGQICWLTQSHRSSSSKISSQANPEVQLHCVSGHPTVYYLDIASDSVVDFQQSLRW